MWSGTRLTRPPVMVSSPVSTSVTRQGSELRAVDLDGVVLQVDGDVGLAHPVVERTSP